MRSEVTVVGSVCVCAPNILYSSHKRPTNDTTYLTGNEGLKVWFSLKMLRCRDPTAIRIVRIQTVGHFYSAENAHVHCDLYIRARMR